MAIIASQNPALQAEHVAGVSAFESMAVAGDEVVCN